MTYIFMGPLWLLGGKLILRNRSGNRETREEAIALGRQEVTAVWMGVGAVEEES